jgi:hypothetical protein
MRLVSPRLRVLLIHQVISHFLHHTSVKVRVKRRLNGQNRRQDAVMASFGPVTKKLRQSARQTCVLLSSCRTRCKSAMHREAGRETVPREAGRDNAEAGRDERREDLAEALSRHREAGRDTAEWRCHRTAGRVLRSETSVMASRMSYMTRSSLATSLNASIIDLFCFRFEIHLPYAMKRMCQKPSWMTILFDIQ